MTPGDLPLLGAPWPDARESVDPGAYYCSHVLWLASAIATTSTDLQRDEEGDAMVGFLHVPPDPWTMLDDETAPPTRHAATVELVAAALRGWLEQTREHAEAAPVRALVTGFGAFRDVVDNPTGAFVHDVRGLQAAISRAQPDRRTAVFTDEVTATYGLVGISAGTLRVYGRALPVDDRCLTTAGESSVAALLAATHAQLWLGLGVGRTTHYRVEVRPTDAGLDVSGANALHAAQLDERAPHPVNRSLARAIVRGARSLDGQASSQTAPDASA